MRKRSELNMKNKKKCPDRQRKQTLKELKIIVTNPKTELEKAEMAIKIGEDVSEYLSNNVKEI